MHSKFRRIFTAVIAVLAIAAVVMPSAASAKKGANKTKVTIVANGGDFSGTISHKKNPLVCANEREVIVYHLLGSKPNPSVDDEVGSDTASNGEWNTGNNGANNGTYYAHAPAIPGCKAGTSKTVKVTGRPAVDF